MSSSQLLCLHCSRHQPAQPLSTSVTLGNTAISAVAPFSYSPEVRSAIHRLKFEQHPELARRAARAMYDAMPLEHRRPTWWIPVPLELNQLVARGFNQSALLANELALLNNGQSFATLLHRQSGSNKQSQLTRAERLVNLDQVFDLNVKARPLPVGSRVVLVDDVFTTGATARACGKVLVDCGYELVAIATLAQVVKPLDASLASPKETSSSSTFDGGKR